MPGRSAVSMVFVLPMPFLVVSMPAFIMTIAVTFVVIISMALVMSVAPLMVTMTMDYFVTMSVSFAMPMALVVRMMPVVYAIMAMGPPVIDLLYIDPSGTVHVHMPQRQGNRYGHFPAIAAIIYIYLLVRIVVYLVFRVINKSIIVVVRMSFGDACENHRQDCHCPDRCPVSCFRFHNPAI